MPKLSDLPDIDFVNIKKDEIEDEIFTLYYEITGRSKLASGDPVRIFLLFIVNVIILLLNKLNKTGKMNMLKDSEKEYLDGLGALVGTMRLTASGASTVIQIKLSAARTQETIIPKGTRVSPEKNIYFATVNDVIIPAGETIAQVTAVCTKTGETGNGYEAGTIHQIIDPISYVASMVNISTSEGGSDTEEDDALRERIFTAPESYSCAGSEGAYIYHAKNVSSAVIDAAADTPSPGVVQIAILLTGGVIPENTVLGEIEEKLSAKTVRPLTDNLMVTPPEAVNYDINLKYWIYDGADASAVSIAVWKVIAGYKLWQRTKLGRDINPDEIINRLKAISGVKRIEILSPVFTVVKKLQVAQDQQTFVTMGGSEEE